MDVTLRNYCIVASILLLAGYFLYHAALPKPIPGIPYNKDATRNLLGDVPKFIRWHAKRPEIFTWMVEQCYTINSPVFQVFMRPFGKPWVVIADFREAQDIMARRTREFDRSPVMGDIFASLLPHQQSHMPTGDEWRAHRKLIGDVESPTFLREVASPQIYRSTLDMIDLWTHKTQLAQGRPFTALDDVFRGALDTIWAATFGSEIGTTKSQVDALSHLNEIRLPKDIDSPAELPSAPTPVAFNSIMTLTDSLEIALKSPFPRQHHSLALKFYPSLRSATKHKEQLVKTQLDLAWTKLSEDSEKDNQLMSATDLVVQREVAMAKKDGRPPQYDTRPIKDELFGFLIAGHVSTSATICWGLKFLTQNQQAQQKVRLALRAHYQDALRENRNPSVDEITKADVPYFSAVVEEVLRCSGSISSNIRTALCDTLVLGHHIPKGTDVFMLSQGPDYMAPPMNVDESRRNQSSIESKDKYGMWDTSNIGAFVPERWVIKNERGEYEFDSQAGPSHPFGAGPRSCFGRRLAASTLKIVFTLVIWRFELKAIPSELSTMAGKDVLTHIPQNCYLRLGKAM